MAKRDRLIVVQLTPPGRGAVATLRVEGPGAAEVVQAELRTQGDVSLVSAPAERLVFSRFGPPPGEEVVVRRLSDETVELHGHGGRAAAAMIEDRLVQRGCRAVDWREWLRDQYDDPIAASAHEALAEARTERTAMILADQLSGALRRAVDEIGQLLKQDEADAAHRELKELLARAELGRHLVRPWRVVLAGPPNAGKSSLVNAMLGYTRAIVHPVPGTTRDVVTATTAVDGWPVEFSDTAGLRPGGDALEQAGVTLARRQLTAADLALLVFDRSQPWSDESASLVESLPDAVVVHNKLDLAPAAGPPRPPGRETSALRGDGIERLLATIARRLVPDPPAPGAAVPFTDEQIALLQRTDEALARGDLPAARHGIQALG